MVAMRLSRLQLYLVLVTLFAFFNLRYTNAQTRLGFSPDTIQAHVDSTYQVEVTIGNVEDLYGVAFDINYDRDIIAVHSLTEGTFLNENNTEQTFFQYYNHEDLGLVIVGLSRVNNDIPGVSSVVDTPLVTINLQVISDGQGQLTLSNVSLYHPDGSQITDFITGDAYVPVEETFAEEIILDAYKLDFIPYPNPFNGRVVFKPIGDTKTSYGAQLKIFNIEGQLVKQSCFDDIRHIVWDPSISGNTISSGIYLYQISVPGNSIMTGKINHLK